jgi:multidrug efflux pump subunit AcrB
MIAEFLYKNPRILLLVVCVILVAGLSAANVMPRLEDPALGRRVAVVTTIYPGADARSVEALVTMRIEEQLTGIAGIHQTRSNSRTGISNIILELADDITDVESVWSLVRTRLRDLEDALPESSQRPRLEVFRLKAFAAIVAIRSAEDAQGNFSVLRKLAGQLRKRINRLPGTESVEVFGDPGEEYVAEIEPAVLAAIQLPTSAIAGQIAAQHVMHPAGFVRSDDTQLALDLRHDAWPLRHLRESMIRYGPTGQASKLSQISHVSKRIATPDADVAWIDGRRAIVLGAFFDDRLRGDRWSENVRTIVSDFQQEYPAEAVVETIFSQQDYITTRLTLLIQNLLMAAAGVVLMVLLLMGWQSMIVVGATLPLSSLMVLAGMRVLEIPLHQMSITGLIVALGLLIDNAIVMVEDIRARIFDGVVVETAVGRSIRHLAMPLFGSTLTTALAFAPIAMLPGPPGEFVGTLAVSVILAISSSFLLAMTVVPALFALMRVDRSRRNLLTCGISSGLASRIYAWSLGVVFRFPLLGLLLGSVLPIVGFAKAVQLPEQFFPPSDRRQVHIELELAAQEPISRTCATARSIQQVVSANAQVERVFWFLGNSAPTFYYNVVPRRRGTAFYGQAIVELQPQSDAEEVVRSLQRQLDESHAEARVIVRQLEQGPPFDAPIEIRIFGPELETLRQLGSQLRLILSQTPRVIHTRSDLEESLPKLVLDVDRQEVLRAGQSDRDIAQQLYTTLEGILAGKVVESEDELPVRVRMANRDNRQLDHLAALRLVGSTSRPAAGPPGAPTPPGGHPPLRALGGFELDADLGAVVRIDGARTNEVKAYIESGVLPSVVLGDFMRRLSESEFRLPAGYELKFGGENAERTQAVRRLMANAGVLVAVVILTLVAAFRSFRCALIIVLVGGLTIGLGTWSLWLFGFPFGFMAIVGTMGLIGVAINDSIVVLASIRENSRARQGDLAELRQVVIGCTRHVLATTLTTIVGFLPLVWGGGKFWPPLAITIAGGVAGATILALYWVPAVHLLLHRKSDRLGLTSNGPLADAVTLPSPY